MIAEKLAVRFDIEVMTAWLVQGDVQVNGRRFWYKCDSGRQSFAELNTNGGEEFAELDATCVCEAIGEKCDGVYCDGIFTDDKAQHVFFAGLCLSVLLNKRGRMVSTR